MIVLAALVFAFHCTAPPANNVGTCARPVMVAASDSVWMLSRTVGLPLPYRFIVDDSVKVTRGTVYGRAYPLAGTVAANDSTRRYWAFVRSSRNGHVSAVRDSAGMLGFQWRANYGCYRSLWGKAQ